VCRRPVPRFAAMPKFSLRGGSTLTVGLLQELGPWADPHQAHAMEAAQSGQVICLARSSANIGRLPIASDVEMPIGVRPDGSAFRGEACSNSRQLLLGSEDARRNETTGRVETAR